MQEKLSPEQREFKLHLAVVKHLDTYYKGKCEWLHIPNRPGDATDGHFKKIMGAKPGASDLMFSWQAHGLNCALIELKAPGEGPSTAQNKFLSRWAFLGWHTAVCKSVKEVNDTLKKWGLDSGANSVMEPNYQTWDEKVGDALAFNAPPKPPA